MSPDGPRRPLSPISIWRPAEVDGEPAFVRPEPGPFGDHWAARRVIPRRCRRQKRLCLLGESTAAGYLLAPHLTPAGALQTRLGRRWDVVDLARTNERLGTLVDTAEAALQLQPDLLVVFTGNNWNLLETPEWSPYLPSTAARRRYGAALGKAGLLGPAQGAARQLRRLVTEACQRLAALAVPVLVVVPEVNLADWQTPQPVGWLAADGVGRWYGLLAEAQAALAGDEHDRALRSTLALLDLDGGSCPTGFRLLSRIARVRGEVEDARTSAQAEVDTCRYATMALLAAPQAGATVQQMLREAAGRHGFGLVDLPRVFAGHERLPGRRWFYDYCHLTPEGIDLAMSAVAGGIEDEVEPGELRLSSRARAAAELGAAVHGVHRGARGEIVRHWCARALESSPDSAGAMLDLVQARAAPVPAVLTPAQLAGPWLTPQQGWRWSGFDAEVVVAVGHALGRRRIAPLLGPPRLEPWSPLDRFYPDAMEQDGVQPPAYLRSPWPWSAYCLVAEGPVEIEIVARLPSTTAAGRVTVDYQGSPVGGFALDAGWQTHRLEIPARPGLGQVVLHWPLPAGPGERHLERTIRRLERGMEADVHPVFGEVFSARIL